MHVHVKYSNNHISCTDHFHHPHHQNILDPNHQECREQVVAVHSKLPVTPNYCNNVCMHICIIVIVFVKV